jgi:ribonuclease P protein component
LPGTPEPKIRYKLPRSKIVRKKSVLRAVRSKGRKQLNRWMILNTQPSSGENQANVAFITPKMIGPATVRNRLRRLMREIYRTHLARDKDSSILVWTARPPAASLTFEELKQAMTSLCKA